ncbi:MAG: helix-turn-helix domain-containing protein [Parasporobacterium sp.]|nr:helix-turn-helix domain-containing protein [Parasporobacterium sp.]
MKKQYFATPEMIKHYHRELAKTRQGIPDVPKTLEAMRDQGLLSEKPLPIPALDGRMDKQEFMQAFDRIPFPANPVIEDFPVARSQDNRVVFSKGMDVICIQHIHNYGYVDQTLGNVYAFTYVYQGSCSYIFDGTEIRLQPGNIFIASPGFSHEVHTTADTFAIETMVRDSAFEILFHDFLTIDSPLAHFLRKPKQDRKNGYYCVVRADPEDEEIRFYQQAIACECVTENLYSNSCAISMIRLFLARAFYKYEDTLELYKHDFHFDRPDQGSILRFIQINYQHITLEEVASYFHYNKTYLSRYIHTHFHRSFSEIVTDLKITQAKSYLLKTDKKITDIAQMVGYESLDHFSRSFKKQTGLSPVAYRKNHMH